MFKNLYNNRKRKEEFWTTQENKESVTDQSQLCSASISAMAEKFGIDAMIQKAKLSTIESEKLKNTLYGNDFTKIFTSREDLLDTKRKLNNLFEKLPAKIRKETFGDNAINFINAYTSNDENKLNELNKIGLVSDRQLNEVKVINKQKNDIAKENEMRKAFIDGLERVKEGMYENYKKTGNIVINTSENNTTSN